MKYVQHIPAAICATLMIAVGATGCSTMEDELADDMAGNEGVRAPLAFSLSDAKASATRMSEAWVMQTEDATRGRLSEVHIYPFGGQEAVGKDDLPLVFDIHFPSVSAKEASSATMSVPEADNARYYYFENEYFMPGVGRFLAYARAQRPQGSLTENAYKARYGSLALPNSFRLEMPPKDIFFEADPIVASNDAPAAAQKLADYLTTIAKAQATAMVGDIATTRYWATTQQSQLRAYYLNFINMTNRLEADIIAGSGANVRKHVNALLTVMEALADRASLPEPNNWDAADEALRTQIITLIKTAPTDVDGFALAADGHSITTLGNGLDDYPRNCGLPDGAAALRWTGSAFAPQTTSTSIANINALTRFAYPAEIYYYANSDINTSIIDKRKTYYPTTNADKWEDILKQYELEQSLVSRRTMAVALRDPLQFAVAHLKLQLNKTATQLRDSDGLAITVGDGQFPLTGIIVGNQHRVGFDFTPVADYKTDPTADPDVRFVYDQLDGDRSTIALSPTTEQASAHTLVLQSYDGEKVKFVLEFLNNSDKTFRGVGGVVYPGTHFYLAGEIDPANGTTGDTASQGRVFTQDYTTTIQVTVSALAKAYNILPNILSPRLEIGVELMPWQETNGSNVPLD